MHQNSANETRVGDFNEARDPQALRSLVDKDIDNLKQSTRERR